MSTPEQPEQASQLSLGLVDTPAGQRLMVTLTLLLDAEGAKSFAAAIDGAASQMSASGLVAVTGVLNGNGVR